MHILNVSGRLCVVDKEVELQAVEITIQKLLSSLPRGMYVAALRFDAVLPELSIVAQKGEVRILSPKQPALPTLLPPM